MVERQKFITREEYLNLPINSVIGILDMENLVSPYVPGKIYRVRGFTPVVGKIAPIIEVDEKGGIPMLKARGCLIRK